MTRRLIQLSVGVLVLLGTCFAIFLVGMRSKSPRVLNLVRRFNREVTNPRQMATAGTPGAYASVVRHIGRTSGRQYETPIGAFVTDDGFIVALPYGRNVDWLQNVLAKGSAVLLDEGNTYLVDLPRVVPVADAIDELPSGERRTLRVFGVDECLRVRRAELLDA